MNPQPQFLYSSSCRLTAIPEAITVSCAPVLEPLLAVHEIVLQDPPQASLFKSSSENTLQWANIYPTLQTIAIGERHATYPTHGHVHAGFLAEIEKNPCVVVDLPDGSTIRAFRLGSDVVIRIGDHEALLRKVDKEHPLVEDEAALRLILDSYSCMLNECLKITRESGGSVIALTDTIPQTLVYSLIESDSRGPLIGRSTTELLPIVNGFVDGNNYVIRIEALPQDCCPGDVYRLAKQYEQTIQIAAVRARERGGAVTLQADGDSQKLVAKLLGRLHQVDDPTKSVAEAIRKKIKTSASGRYIYNANTGTRYYFPDDLRKIADKAKVPNFSDPEKTQLVAQHYLEVTTTISELARFLNSRNQRGNREGQIFLTDPTGQRIDNQSDKLDRWATKIEDLVYTIDSSSPEDACYHVSKQLGYIVDELKKASHQDFHSINLKSPRFVRVVSRAIRSEQSRIDLGEDFSTPLNAQEFGGFLTDSLGNRKFLITSQDPQLQAIGRWLFSDAGQQALSGKDPSYRITEADYVCVYIPETPLTFEPHPTGFVRRWGHLEAKSFVVEFGRLGDAPQRWVVEENVWAPARWSERHTPTIERVKEPGGEYFLSTYVKYFKDAQYELFGELLAALSGSAVTLAPPYEWVSIPGAGPGDSAFDNYRVRPFINGTRSDKVKFDELGSLQLLPTMTMLGDLMVAGIIAQLPHLPRRDIILSKAPGKQSIGKVTFLSPGESFCHSTRAKNIKEYLREVAPMLYGNHIAGWLAPIGYLERSGDETNWRTTQELLVDTCVEQIGKRLGEISRGCDSRGARIRDVLHEKMDIAAERYPDDESKVWRPEELNIGTFLPFSRELVKLRRPQIRALCKSIKESAIKELRLIEKIAPAPPKGSNLEQWAEVDACAKAVSSLIEGHLSEPSRLKEAIGGLKTLAKDLSLLTATERNWYIPLMNVNMRIAELGKTKDLGKIFAKSFHEATDEKRFYDLLVKDAPTIDLEYGTICACYQAIDGLRSSFQNLPEGDPKAVQLKKALKSLRPLGKLITG